MRTIVNHRAYSILALLLSLVLLCGCAAPAAGAAAAPTPTPPSTVPDTPAPTSAPTPAAEKNGMYDLLSEVFDRYHAGTAGSSLTAAYLAATMVDWAAVNGRDAVLSGARAWDRGTETEYGESFAEKLAAVRDAAVRLADGGTGVLEDCGYKGSWDHSMQEVTDTFDAIFEGLGLDAAAESAAAQSSETGAVAVTVESESEQYYDSRKGETIILYYRCAWPTVSVSASDSAAAAINASLEEQRLRYVSGPEEQQEGVTEGRDNFLRAADEDLRLRTEDGMADSFAPFAYQRSVDIPRADEAVLSVVYDDTTYMGGAHGYTLRNTVIFDTRTGAQLRLDELGENGVDFLDELQNRLRQVAESAEYGVYPYWDNYRDILPTLLRDGNWYFSRDGLVVIANPYEMDSYAAGLIEFTIPYEWLVGKLRAEYIPSESFPEGSLSGEILPRAAQTDYLVDDGTDGEGAAVTFTAHGRVDDVAIRRVNYMEYNNTFWETGLLWYASAMQDGETLTLLTWIPDAAPNLEIRYTDTEGQKCFYISMSGKDGSLVLMDGREFPSLPREITQELPYVFDLDGDGKSEVIDMQSSGSHWKLTVSGTELPTSYALDAQYWKLWLTDLDHDGAAELFFTGDMGSDDYVTCGWRGDTLTPISFFGDTRYGRSGALTDTADGELCFSLATPMLRSWIYQMGTYAAFRPYEMTNSLMGPAEGSEWTYRSNSYELETVQELPVAWADGSEGKLPVGSRLILKGCDGGTTRFETSDGKRGSIWLEYRTEGVDSGWFIDGVSENKYFAMLPYVG